MLPYAVGILILILLMRKLRSYKVKQLALDYTTDRSENSNVSLAEFPTIFARGHFVSFTCLYK